MRASALLTVLVIAMSLFAESALASLCIDDWTLMENFTSNGTAINLTFTCSDGCVNDRCAGTDATVDIQAMWLIWAVGTTMLIVSIVLGIPTGQIPTHPAELVDMRAVMRYLFFFVGFMFVYFSFGTARGIVSAYGGSAGATTAAETATMVCMWTLVLFLLIFMVELTFSATDWLKKQRIEKREQKWKGRQ